MRTTLYNYHTGIFVVLLFVCVPCLARVQTSWFTPTRVLLYTTFVDITAVSECHVEGRRWHDRRDMAPFGLGVSFLDDGEVVVGRVQIQALQLAHALLEVYPAILAGVGQFFRLQWIISQELLANRCQVETFKNKVRTMGKPSTVNIAIDRQHAATTDGTNFKNWYSWSASSSR
jgi:hypothetical protein